MFTLKAGEGAVIFKNMYAPQTEGQDFRELCADEESRQRFDNAFAECVAYHRDQFGIAVTIVLSGDFPIEVVINLQWCAVELVLCFATRHFDLSKLSPLERRVLPFAADPNFSDGSIATFLDTSRATIRSAKTRIRTKLHISRPEGWRMAARQLGSS